MGVQLQIPAAFSPLRYLSKRFDKYGLKIDKQFEHVTHTTHLHSLTVLGSYFQLSWCFVGERDDQDARGGHPVFQQPGHTSSNDSRLSCVYTVYGMYDKRVSAGLFVYNVYCICACACICIEVHMNVHDTSA